MAAIDFPWDYFATCATWKPIEFETKSLILLVPGERFELPTNGLQNRCSTTELTRQINGLSGVYPRFATLLLPFVSVGPLAGRRQRGRRRPPAFPAEHGNTDQA